MKKAYFFMLCCIGFELSTFGYIMFIEKVFPISTLLALFSLASLGFAFLELTNKRKE